MTENASTYYRFCPDQTHIKISEAVCASRRRVRYPQCKGCQFNDDEKTADQPPAEDSQNDSED